MPRELDDTSDSRLSIGVSSCLAGQKVRYDGDARPHNFIIDTLAAVCELIPVCPEAGIGMGVPRPPIHLVGDRKSREAVGVDDPSLNVTNALKEYASSTAKNMPQISGYLFKSRSPSCGVGSVSITSKSGFAQDGGNGLFAQEIMQSMPLLPVAEETCLDDPLQRDNYFERVCIYQRWLLAGRVGLTMHGLQEFHDCHELTIRTRGDDTLHSLTSIISEARLDTLPQVAERYIACLMQAMQARVSTAQHVKVMKRIAGILETRLTKKSLSDLGAAIKNYGNGRITLPVLSARMRQLLAIHPHEWLQKQAYLYPSKQETKLRF